MSTDAAELTFNHLREVNDARCVEWSGDTPWEPDTHLNEFIGELGEACNVIKKLRRIQDKMPGTDPAEKPALLAQLKDEMGDAQICLDKWASSLNIDLGLATIDKFNKTSIKVGFPHRLAA